MNSDGEVSPLKNLRRHDLRHGGRVYVKKPSDSKESKDITTTFCRKTWEFYIKNPSDPPPFLYLHCQNSSQNRHHLVQTTAIKPKGWAGEGTIWGGLWKGKRLLPLVKVKRYKCNSSDFVSGSNALFVWTIHEQEVVRIL